MSDLGAYHDMIAAKRIRFAPRGLTEIPALRACLKPLQAAGVDFALRQGCAALFYDTGLGKTLAELEWSRIVAQVTGKPVPILAPLAVGPQHQAEAERFGYDAKVVRNPSEIGDCATPIFNYELLDRFEAGMFGGVSLDESSILKSFTGATSRALRNTFADTPFRLSASATPAPNDHTELGQQAEFLGVMRSSEMLSRFFINDTMKSGNYRLKKPAIRPFWDWVASWSRCAEKPSDLGFSDDGYDLPELRIVPHTVIADVSQEAGTERKSNQILLFRIPEMSATSIHREKRLTLDQRMDKTAEIVAAEPDQTWVTWVETDAEEQAVCARLPDAVAVRGSHRPQVKEERLTAFTRGEIHHLVTKPSIAGFGLNWQHVGRHAFPSASYSYEMFYQAIRRSWRFGRRDPVHAHCIGADTERAIQYTRARKAQDHVRMKAEMRAAMQRASQRHSAIEEYQPQREASLPGWIAA